MGASQFEDQTSAVDARTAFDNLRDQARYESGHGGYTGTIAEKSSFKMVTLLKGETAAECVERCYATKGHFCDDKWGPAACIDLGADPNAKANRIFLFFGFASS